MRRLFMLAAFALLIIGLVGGNALARDGSVTEVTLFGQETTSTVISATGQVDPPEDDPDAFGPGARFVSIDTLYSDPERTTVVGRNDITCTVIDASGTTEQDFAATLSCHGVVTLDGQGTLAWAGSVVFSGAEAPNPDEPFVTVAITGGTGGFMAAGGEVDIFETPGATEDETLSRYEATVLDLH